MEETKKDFGLSELPAAPPGTNRYSCVNKVQTNSNANYKQSNRGSYSRRRPYIPSGHRGRRRWCRLAIIISQTSSCLRCELYNVYCALAFLVPQAARHSVDSEFFFIFFLSLSPSSLIYLKQTWVLFVKSCFNRCGLYISCLKLLFLCWGQGVVVLRWE